MSQHAVARLVFSSPLRAPTTSMNSGEDPYHTPEKLEELHAEGRTTEEVNELVLHPVCGWGHVKDPYPVKDPLVWQWLTLVRGHASLDPVILLMVRRVCRVAGVPMDLSTMIFADVMGTPLPNTRPRSVPDWIREEHEVTRERPEDQPWCHPAGLSPDEVLKLAKAQRQAEWDVVKQTLLEKRT
jgi:hypothetical protein